MNRERRMVPFIVGDGAPMVTYKIGRNQLCTCKSGKKAKHCCGVETKWYSTKPKNTNPIHDEYKEEERGQRSTKGLNDSVTTFVEEPEIDYTPTKIPNDLNY